MSQDPVRSTTKNDADQSAAVRANLNGVEACRRREWAAAAAFFAEAVSRAPTEAKYHHNLGAVRAEQGLVDEACDSLRTAWQLEPQSPRRKSLLATTLASAGSMQARFGRFTRAASVLREAIELGSEAPETWMEFGNCLCNMGRTAEAMRALEEAVRLERNGYAAASLLLLTSHYDPSLSPEQLFAAHREFGRKLEAAAGERFRHSPKDVSGRRLRIGYVSGDLRQHSVAYVLEPLLEFRNAKQFEVFCYSDSDAVDSTTERLKALSDRWIDIHELDDEACAQMIYEQRPDILVDLGGHSGRSRLGVFARRPAPVQISAFGYMNTTGLRSMDFRLTDAIADPPGPSDRLNVEVLLRLDPCFLCYRPPVDAPEIAARSSEDPIVFCSFNSRRKITPEVLDTWAEILRQVPRSMLLLKSFETVDPEIAAALRADLEGRGIARERILVVPASRERRDHLALYNEADIALDPFPYTGVITTLEALWMGVPAVALTGSGHVSRLSTTILNAAGLNDWAASSREAYVRIAVAAAKDRKSLATLRGALRSNMRSSALTSGAEYVEKLERLYQAAFRTRFSGSAG